MDMEDIKQYIDYLKANKISDSEAKKLLADNKTLDSNTKNLIYMYCYPRQLKDYGLPERIQQYRKSCLSGESGKKGDPVETILLVEACQTEQYGRFMKHLMHAFGNSDNVSPIAGSDSDHCCLCGKEVFGIDKWKLDYSATDPEKHKMSFGSSESSSIICIDCLAHLIESMEIINSIDPGFLDWTKRKSIQEAWNKIRPF